MNEAPWAAHVRAAIPPEVKASHGWHRPFEVRYASEQRLVLDAGGLLVPYQCGVIKLDFANRTLLLLGIDQKTPCEERWELNPPPDWWERAQRLSWPGMA